MGSGASHVPGGRGAGVLRQEGALAPREKGHLWLRWPRPRMRVSRHSAHLPGSGTKKGAGRLWRPARGRVSRVPTPSPASCWAYSVHLHRARDLAGRLHWLPAEREEGKQKSDRMGAWRGAAETCWHHPRGHPVPVVIPPRNRVCRGLRSLAHSGPGAVGSVRRRGPISQMRRVGLRAEPSRGEAVLENRALSLHTGLECLQSPSLWSANQLILERERI